MRIAVSAALLLGASALPVMAQDYYETTANARHGNGYVPATITAGWEQQASFTVIAISHDGTRQASGDIAPEWKAVVTIGPKGAVDDRDDDDDRYQDRKATTPKSGPTPTGPKVVRKEVTYGSLTCPALAARIEALKPLTTFEFNPPSLKGNEDGPNGDGHQGLDLWVRIGGGELTKSAETANSKLGGWFKDTLAVLSSCPATPKAP
jgi:hypothetical protein